MSTLGSCVTPAHPAKSIAAARKEAPVAISLEVFINVPFLSFFKTKRTISQNTYIRNIKVVIFLASLGYATYLATLTSRKFAYVQAMSIAPA